MEKGTQLTAQLSVGKKVVLGLQHVLAMFGATVLGSPIDRGWILRLPFWARALEH